MLKTRAGLTLRRFVARRYRRDGLPFLGRFRGPMSGISWRDLGYLAVHVATVPIILSGCSRPAQTPPIVTQAPAATSANATAPPPAQGAPPAPSRGRGSAAAG